MATISPSDSVLLHKFLTKGSDRFETIIPALALLAGVLLTQLIEWLRRTSEANREDRRFIRQRWWDRRAEAYSEIMKSLARMRVVAQAEIAIFGTENELSDAHIEKWRQAREVLDDATGQGMFMISDAALECLKELRKEMAKSSPPGDHQGELLDDLDAIEKAIPKFAEIARGDLGGEHLPDVRGEMKKPR